MKVRILTLFPEMFNGPFGTSILKKAQEKELIDIQCFNIRDFALNKHKKVDDYPFGGGAGMVMTPQPIFDCHHHVTQMLNLNEPCKTIYLSPKGSTFTQEKAMELAKEEQLIFLCGHYEGIDQRIIDELVTDEISIGDYVLTGGELPAMVIVDAITRLIPGVLSTEASYEDESFHCGLLEYPHYTRPRAFNGLEVPSVLLSGNHKDIDMWRRKQSIELTFERRPDLLKGLQLKKNEAQWVAELSKKKE
ncbi:tRNA (guanine-N1)-methyltransferase [Alkaliphilus metalliredigens QYMF]|uniref:tRNA (guanine-N(1)-)-methyltransferase n=1 Tax=Alkaliphilus metalliredigens (strain QYMF) TaxID=293826 RepID=TRMD_ALKMQ|nr:tRNA (guanosine(37)-N1)-methyltransferase TrmD [Alkaliphilus metalliredigens]A6TRS6.1 RecName: Full=tRNA (guanine-N(1)-)-methyltransferase; AltName: Full=M1G-methyltransferase; AltName: Full=tRNA [GM37] methyltransferase [Alkaliphilus metalliredigens QYMF]ABR48894.1 tRNA (guanine-N1)-methyltransferase [Alkaliphilus metalliredigens QYMF]